MLFPSFSKNDVNFMLNTFNLLLCNIWVLFPFEKKLHVNFTVCLAGKEEQHQVIYIYMKRMRSVIIHLFILYKYILFFI